MRFYFPIRDVAPGEIVELVKEHDHLRAEGLGLSPSVSTEQLVLMSIVIDRAERPDKLVSRLVVRSISDKPIRLKAFMYDRNDPLAMSNRFQAQVDGSFEGRRVVAVPAFAKSVSVANLRLMLDMLDPAEHSVYRPRYFAVTHSGFLQRDREDYELAADVMSIAISSDDPKGVAKLVFELAL